MFFHTLQLSILPSFFEVFKSELKEYQTETIQWVASQDKDVVYSSSGMKF